MVEGGGFEPPKAEPSDLQSDPFGHSGTPPGELCHILCLRGIPVVLYVELATGIEPATSSLQVRCSTS